MSSALDLVVLNGPLEGQVWQLRPNEPLKVGRSARGLQLTDPLVSLNHAEVTWEGDRYWVEDLGSATGTFVNDVRLTEKAVPVVTGMRIRLGETELEVRDRPRSAVLRIAGLVSAVFILVLGVRAFMDSIEVKYRPVVRWYETVHQGAGYESDLLEIPVAFIRETGVDHRGLTIERVTDYDGNGVDELWVSWRGGHRVLTFDNQGNWITIADLPESCRHEATTIAEGLPAECYATPGRVRTEVPEICKDYETGKGFPELDCNGVTYRFEDGAYEIANHEGVYVWMPPTRTVQVEDQSIRRRRRGEVPMTDKQIVVRGHPEPYLFTLIRPAEFAGFLAERGVVDPVHYMICEGALPGVRAQVLTEAGELIPLTVGCIGDVMVEGPTRRQDFGEGVPNLFAFTGTGYDALLEDVATYLSGSTDRLFMDANELAFYEALTAQATRRVGALRVAFNGGARIFDPIAAEGELPEDRMIMHSEFAESPPPLAHTVTITESGRYELEGCSELEVEVHDWHCLFTKGCGEGSAFMTLQNIGCGAGEPVVIPYARGLHGYRDEVIDARVAVESIDVDGQIDVLRARFSYRSIPEGDAAP